MCKIPRYDQWQQEILISSKVKPTLWDWKFAWVRECEQTTATQVCHRRSFWGTYHNREAIFGNFQGLLIPNSTSSYFYIEKHAPAVQHISAEMWLIFKSTKYVTSERGVKPRARLALSTQVEVEVTTRCTTPQKRAQIKPSSECDGQGKLNFQAEPLQDTKRTA